MGVWARVETRDRNTYCSRCTQLIKGKNQEFCFRASKNGSGVNFCSKCLRLYADEIDKQNKIDEPGSN